MTVLESGHTEILAKRCMLAEQPQQNSGDYNVPYLWQK